MKKSIKAVLSLALAFSLATGLSACSKKEEAPASNTNQEEKQSDGSGEKTTFNIGVVQLAEHAALSSANEGFMAALNENGFGPDRVTVDYQNAQGDQSNLKTISERFVQNEVDLILAIATPAAQSVANETSDIPILITAVTDPAESQLVNSNENPGTNVSGTSDLTPVKEQFDLMKKILPEAKTVGILYNSSEANSEIQAKIAEEYAEELNLNYELATVTGTNDITQAVQSVIGKIDVLYIPTDNTIASAIATVSSIANENKVPTIVGEAALVEGGGLATIGIDYYDLGYQTGMMAIDVMNGADIATMPIQYVASPKICVNLDTAKEIGITIPQDIIDAADKVIETK